MLQNRIIKVSRDGLVVSCLQIDFLSGLGHQQMARASSVEFEESINRWVVEIKIGPLAHSCLIQTFEKRTDALTAEVALLNEQHSMSML